MTTVELAAKLGRSRQWVLVLAAKKGLKPLNRGKRGQPAVWPKGTIHKLRRKVARVEHYNPRRSR